MLCVVSIHEEHEEARSWLWKQISLRALRELSGTFNVLRNIGINDRELS